MVREIKYRIIDKKTGQAKVVRGEKE